VATVTTFGDSGGKELFQDNLMKLSGSDTMNP
jgi:hypothetical protein